MTDPTPNLDINYVEGSQAQKHVTVNEAFRTLDIVVQPSVLDKDLSTPPASPAPGDKYLVGASATGVWAGHEDKLAAWIDGGWYFAEPKTGWQTYVADETTHYVYTEGTGWAIPAGNAPDLSGYAQLSGAAFTGNLSIEHAGTPSLTIDTTAGSSRTAYLRMKGARTTTSSNIAQIDFVNNLDPEVTAATFLINGDGDVNLSTGNLKVGGNSVLVLDTSAKTLAVGNNDFTLTQTQGDVANVIWWDGSASRLSLGTFGAGNGKVRLRAPIEGEHGGTFAVGGSLKLDINQHGVGVNGASADANNQFAFFGTNVLFNSSGSIDQTYNKNATGDDATFSFKTGFATKAIVGLQGDDDFTIKTGSAFNTAIIVKETTGEVLMPNTPGFKQFVQQFAGAWLLDPNEHNGWGPRGFVDEANTQDLGNVGADYSRVAGGFMYPFDVKILGFKAKHYNSNATAHAWGWRLGYHTWTDSSNVVNTTNLLQEVADNAGVGPRNYLSTTTKGTDLDLSANGWVMPAGAVLTVGIEAPTAEATNYYVNVMSGFLLLERVNN